MEHPMGLSSDSLVVPINGCSGIDDRGAKYRQAQVPEGSLDVISSLGLKVLTAIEGLLLELPGLR